MSAVAKNTNGRTANGRTPTGQTLAIKNARLYTVSHGIIDRGTVVAEDGKIAAVGANFKVPAGATVIDASGKVVMPGIVEAHCHLSVFDFFEDDMEGGEGGGRAGGPGGGGAGLPPATTPDLDYYWAFNPRSESLKLAYAAGVTTILTRPGSGKVISGQDLVAKTWGRSREEMVILHPAGVKMAFGENAKRNFGSRGLMPSTRMGIAALLREALTKAQNYKRRKERYAAKLAEYEKAVKGGKKDAKPPEPVPYDYQLEPLVKVLNHELPARVHAHRADDIMTVLRIADEFGFELSLEHASETHKIVSEVKKRNIPCVVGPTMVSRGKVETREKTFATPGILERAGIKVAITTDASVVPIEHLRMAACLAYREGMSEAGALSAITLAAAEIARVADRVGSLDVGKDADLLIMDGHPLQFRTSVLKTFIDGVEVFDRATFREDWER
ncbi:MAG: amidohydrolase [Bacillota bacterium]